MFIGKTKWVLLLALILWAGGGVLYYLNQQAELPTSEPPKQPTGVVSNTNGSDSAKSPEKMPLIPSKVQTPDAAVQDKNAVSKTSPKAPKAVEAVAPQVAVIRSAELADLEYRVKEVLRANRVPENRLGFLFSGRLAKLDCIKAADPGDWPSFYNCKIAYDIHLVNDNKTNVIELDPGDVKHGASDLKVAKDYTMDALVEKLAQIVVPKIYPAKERNKNISLLLPDKSIQKWGQAADRLSEMADAVFDERRDEP